MPKTCTLCGFQPEVPSKKDDVPEDCLKCRAKKSVVMVEEEDEDE